MNGMTYTYTGGPNNTNINISLTYAYRPMPKSQFYYEARPGQLFYLAEFLTPTSYPVIQIAKEIPGQTLETVGPAIWSRVMSKIKYVLDREQFNADEWFMFPFELLKSMKGDCEDSANLAASLLIACGVTDAAVVYGTVVVDEGVYKHAWVEVGDTLIEATLPRWDPKRRPPYYQPEWKVAWGFSYQVGMPKGYKFGVDMSVFGFAFGMNSNENEKPQKTGVPKLDPEALKRLHEKLEKEAT